MTCCFKLLSRRLVNRFDVEFEGGDDFKTFGMVSVLFVSTLDDLDLILVAGLIVVPCLSPLERVLGTMVNCFVRAGLEEDAYGKPI
jgi:hypothetical protein